VAGSVREHPRVLIFDLFGVLTAPMSLAEQHHVVVAAGAAAEADPDRFWAAYWDLRPPYDSSHLTPDQYWRAVGAELGAGFDAEAVARLRAADIGAWRGVDPAMEELLKRLAGEGRTLALLSNIPEELAVDFEARHPWFDVFSVRGYSCRIGAAKPDPATFRWMLERLGVGPADAAFIDDRPENVAAAVALGIRGKLFVGSEDLAADLDLW
jgi:putative hydrolase of the HAD superfamily